MAVLIRRALSSPPLRPSTAAPPVLLARSSARSLDPVPALPAWPGHALFSPIFGFPLRNGPSGPAPAVQQLPGACTTLDTTVPVWGGCDCHAARPNRTRKSVDISDRSIKGLGANAAEEPLRPCPPPSTSSNRISASELLRWPSHHPPHPSTMS